MPEESLLESIKFQLITSGSARLRSGKRRTYQAAQKTLQSAADEAGINVSIKRGKGFVEAVNKDW